MRYDVPKGVGRMSSDKKLYATCPICGRRLCRAVPGSEVEQECPKCPRVMVLIKVDLEGKVITQVVQPQQA